MGKFIILMFARNIHSEFELHLKSNLFNWMLAQEVKKFHPWKVQWLNDINHQTTFNSISNPPSLCIYFSIFPNEMSETDLQGSITLAEARYIINHECWYIFMLLQNINCLATQ